MYTYVRVFRGVSYSKRQRIYATTNGTISLPRLDHFPVYDVSHDINVLFVSHVQYVLHGSHAL